MYKKVKKDHLKICFIGCGNICRRHAKGMKKKQIDIAFASRSMEKANAYTNEFKGYQSYGDYETAITQDSAPVVFITTPPNSHYDLTALALDHGKHVIIEKPPFLSVADMKKLGEKADTAGLQLLVAENYYYRPLRKKIVSYLSAGYIGTPLFIQLSATKKQESKNDWREQKEVAGFGALFEGGIHWVNFMNNLGFDLSDVKGYQCGEEHTLERSMMVSARAGENAVINLLYSWEVDTIFQGLRISRIYGSEGSITFESNGLFVFVRGKKWRFSIPSLRHITGFAPMYDDFIRALHTGKAPLLHWSKAIKDLEVIEAAYHTSG